MSWTHLPMGLVLVVVACGVAAGGSPQAQFEHVHLTVSDFRGAVAWYATHMEGRDEGTSVSIGSFRLRFHLEQDAEIRGSAGSVIDHIAFSFGDLDAKLRELEGAGATILAPVGELPEGLTGAVVEDPWGTRIEILQDPERQGFHHVCVRGPEPTAILDWLVENLGGDRGRYRDRLDGVRYGEVWVVAEDSGGEPVAAVGAHLQNENAGWRAIDHLGFVVDDLEATEKQLRKRGVRFTLDPRPFLTARLAGVEGPYELVVELVDLEP